MGEKRAALTAVAAVLGGVLLVAVLVTWAASIGPSGVLTGPGPQAVHTTPTETASEPTDPFTQLRTEDQDRLAKQHDANPALRTVALVLEIAAALVLLLLAYRQGRRAWENWKARQRPPAEPTIEDFDVLGAAQRVTDEIRRDAGHQRDLLRGGSPRNGIVECWHRFEVQAADAGLASYSWETSSEYALRMLDLVFADSHAVARLAALYREARFSDHELGEDARAEALAALDAVHAGLLGSRS